MGAGWLPIAIYVTLCALHGALAASLGMQDQGNPPPGALQQNDEPNYQLPPEHSCQKCPAGHRVISHCKTPGTLSECKPCDNETYAKHINPSDSCIPCTICRGLDQVELQPCTRTSDAQCACKNGTYCSPNLPCETCRKCTPRCPDGEMMVKPCTPTSNIQCLPFTISPTPRTPATGSHGHSIGWTVGCFLAAVAVAVAVTLGIKYRDKFGCCTGASSTGSAADRLHNKTFQCLQKNCSQGRQEEQENVWKVDQASQQSSQSHTNSSTSEMIPLQATPLPEEESLELAPEERRNLVPANGEDPTNILRRSFDTFIKEVPVKHWKRYLRALGLTDNEIDIAKMTDSDINEQHFQMLQTWQQKNGRQATVDVLLEKLYKIEDKGIEQNIREKLISEGLYIYEE